MKDLVFVLHPAGHLVENGGMPPASQEKTTSSHGPRHTLPAMYNTCLDGRIGRSDLVMVGLTGAEQGECEEQELPAGVQSHLGRS